jgi:hypothetical protein
MSWRVDPERSAITAAAAAAISNGSTKGSRRSRESVLESVTRAA